jgi:hypothetical protein
MIDIFITKLFPYFSYFMDMKLDILAELRTEMKRIENKT